MTICTKCKYRLQCRTKTINYKIYCQWCGCLDAACHCAKPDLIKSKVSNITLTKNGDCKTCKVRKKCIRLMSSKDPHTWEYCGYCGCLHDVCHCSLKKGQMEKDNKEYEVK